MPILHLSISQLEIEIEYYGLLEVIYGPAGEHFSASELLDTAARGMLVGWLAEPEHAMDAASNDSKLPDSDTVSGGKASWSIVFRGSVDGFSASTFHSKCDQFPCSVSVIRTNTGRVFGGFAAGSWGEEMPPVIVARRVSCFRSIESKSTSALTANMRYTAAEIICAPGEVAILCTFQITVMPILPHTQSSRAPQIHIIKFLLVMMVRIYSLKPAILQ
jgi:TLD